MFLKYSTGRQDHSAARFYAIYENSYRELTVIQLRVESVLFQKLFVVALFNDVTVFHYKYHVRFTDS